MSSGDHKNNNGADRKRQGPFPSKKKEVAIKQGPTAAVKGASQQHRHPNNQKNNKGPPFHNHRHEQRQQKDNDEGPYIVIIKNAENDFCRIHEEALPVFLGLASESQLVKRSEGSSYYNSSIRSETHTAEFTFHGTDESAYFRPASFHTGKGAKRGREEEEEGPQGPSEEGEGNNTSDAHHASASSAAAPRYASVSDMLQVNRVKEYFNTPLQYTLAKHVAGDEGDDSTRSSKKVNEHDTVVSEYSNQRGPAHEEPQGDQEEEQQQRQQARPFQHHDVAQSLQDKLVSVVADVTFTGSTLSSSSDHDRVKEERVQSLRSKQLRQLLEPVSGFMSCWFLRGRPPQQHLSSLRAAPTTVATYRLIFASMTHLFAAKDLLDQVEADRGVRVSIKFSVPQQVAYQEHQRATHAAEAAELM